MANKEERCRNCGAERENKLWEFCPFCGEDFLVYCDEDYQEQENKNRKSKVLEQQEFLEQKYNEHCGNIYSKEMVKEEENYDEIDDMERRRYLKKVENGEGFLIETPTGTHYRSYDRPDSTFDQFIEN